MRKIEAFIVHKADGAMWDGDFDLAHRLRRPRGRCATLRLALALWLASRVVRRQGFGSSLALARLAHWRRDGGCAHTRLRRVLDLTRLA